MKTRHDKFPEVIKPVLDSIEAISETFWKLLKGGAENNIFPKALELVGMNQSLLNCLGVGHPQLDRVAQVAAAHGLAAKLTGAGGGGCALLLCQVGTSHAQGTYALCLPELGFWILILNSGLQSRMLKGMLKAQ